MSKALIVDDSSTVRSIIASFLDKLGIPSDQACNGQDALDKLAMMSSVDIAFVDWNMPIMSGIEFVRKIRADGCHPGLKIVMVTTQTEMENVANAIEAGADEYIMKPFTQEMFSDKLQLLGFACELKE